MQESTRLSPSDAIRDELALAGRNFGPRILWDAYATGRIDAPTLRAIILDVWSAAEFPEHQLGSREWRFLFRVAGFVTDPPGQSPPARSLTVYRGSGPRYSRGMAWTLDPDVARFFAERWELSSRVAWQLAESGRRPGKGPASVYRATVPPSGVLAMLDTGTTIAGRDEKEIIVDPDKLTNKVRLPDD